MKTYLNGWNIRKGDLFRLNNSHSTAIWGCNIPEIYYDKENQVTINQSVNEFYTRFLFKIDALPQELGFPLDINTTFFKNLSPDVRELFIP